MANTYHLRDAVGVDHQHGRPERRPTTDQSRWQCDTHCVTGGFYVQLTSKEWDMNIEHGSEWAVTVKFAKMEPATGAVAIGCETVITIDAELESLRSQRDELLAAAELVFVVKHDSLPDIVAAITAIKYAIAKARAA